MTHKISDEQLQQQLEHLNKDIQPSRDLWVGIERALEHQCQQPQQRKRAASNFSPYAWAASIVLSVVVVWQWFGGQSAPVSVVALSPVNTIQQQHQQHKQAMLVSFGQPDLRQLPAEIKQQFAELDSAKQSLVKALEDDPNNNDLLNLLQWTQQQELALLEQLYKPKWQSI